MGQTEQFSSSAVECAVSSHSPTKSHTNTVFWKSLADLKPWWKNCSRAATKLFSPHSRTVRLPLCATHINTSMHKSKCWYNIRSLTFGKWCCYFVCYLVHTYLLVSSIWADVQCNEACLCGQVTWHSTLSSKWLNTFCYLRYSHERWSTSEIRFNNVLWQTVTEEKLLQPLAEKVPWETF